MRSTRSGSTLCRIRPRIRSQPPFSMHPPSEDSGRGSHQQQREIEAFGRVEAEERDVHPERARDDGDRQGDREDDREDFDHLVGLVRHEGRLDFHQAPRDFSIRIERVQDADHVVLDVPQVVPHLLAEEGDFEPAQDPEDVPLRPQVIPEADQVRPDIVEMRDARPTRSRDDLLLELVQEGLESVQVRKIRIHEDIEDRVREEIRPCLQDPGGPFSQTDADVLQLREHLVVDRDDELLPEEDGQLIRLDLFRPDDRSDDDENGVVVHFHLRMEVLVLGVLQREWVESEERLELVERPLVRIDDVHPGDGVFLDEFPTPADRGVWLLEEIGRRVGDDLDADHAPRTSQSPLNPCARRRCGNSKWPPFLADDGGRMKVVHRKDAKALNGDKSLSYQVISPDNVGSRKFLVTVVDIRPGGSTPVHEHRTVESMYYILEGRGEVTSGREHKVLGPDTAGFLPARPTPRNPEFGQGPSPDLSRPPPPHRDRKSYSAWKD